MERLGFGDWIESLSEGVDTVISPNTISGGQRQSISNARALLSDAPIIMMDEPFSALDVQKEAHLIREIETKKKECILLIISHREETLTCCDEQYFIFPIH